MTIFMLGWYEGLRIHECFRIDTATAAQALREQTITIKGKGGLVRTLPLNPILKPRFRYHLEQTPRGGKLFVPDGVPTHQAIKALQAFIYVHRPYAQDPDSTRPMTFHGLRHLRGQVVRRPHPGGRFPLCCPQGRGRAPRPWAG